MLKKAALIVTPILFLSNCANMPSEGMAAAILDSAVPSSIAHARALTQNDLDEIRRTGLELIATVNCWPEGCAK